MPQKFLQTDLKELFTDKPECVTRFPGWMLPPEKIERYHSFKNPAIIEIAGRDSVAAAVKAVSDRGFTDLIPTFVYTGSEYGPWSTVPEAVQRLKSILKHTHIHDLLVFGSPKFWRAINGRFMSELTARYDSFSSCTGCHLYLHSVRIPLSVLLGRLPIIGGEREFHDNRIKINQIPEALHIYTAVLNHFNVELILPLRNINKGSEIANLLGIPWNEGEEQLGCVLSGNYVLSNNAVSQKAATVKNYLEEFAGPCVQNIISVYLQGEAPDHVRIVKKVLDNL